jgi:basic amino acid/polyamine antiporter, APA family
MSLWDKKAIEPTLEQSELSKYPLKRVLGPFSLMSLGIGAIIGAGLFSITGIAAANYAGPAVIISFLIAGLGCAFAGLCYSELTSMIPLAGSVYTYAYVAMGELIAWMIGWDLILEYAIGAATVSISWSAYVVSFLRDFNIELPPALIASPWHATKLADGTEVYGWINLPAVLIIMLLSLLLMRGVKESSLLNNVLVTIKLSIIVIFIAIGVNYIEPSNYTPFIPENTGSFGHFGYSGIMRASGMVFFAYIGFDSLSTAAQETQNPQRNMPIGILGSLVICTILYILFAAVMVGMVSYHELNVAAPVALAIDKTPYAWLNGLVKLAIIAGLSSTTLVMLMGQARIFYAMSRDGLLPEAFSRIHPKFRTPWISNLTLMVLVALVGGMAPIEMLGNMTSIGTLLAFIIVCCGVWI